jgi:hypothetical protein
MPLVEFFGIGAPRSGTSWIAKCLDEHAELAVPVKETHHFSRENEYRKGAEFYESRIAKFHSGAGMIGEFCPNYFAVEACADRLYSYNPHAPLVVILRNPIDRAFSHFLFEVRHGQVDISNGILSYLDSRHEYLMHGYYHRCLKRYVQAGFSRDKILILFYEEININPIAEYKKILVHLGVKDIDFVPASMSEKVNETRVLRNRSVERFFDIVDKILKSPKLFFVRRLISKTGVPSKLRRINSKNTKLSLTKVERSSLRDLYSSDVADLEEFLGRKVPWKDFLL